jgi:hypothetical protein
MVVLPSDQNAGIPSGRPGSLVETLNAQGGVAVVVGGNVYGGVNVASQPRPASEYVIDFADRINLARRGFVGRAAVFASLTAFTTSHPNGYFEIVADAGLGKTALAAEIAHRTGAVAFFDPASSTQGSADGFLTHLSAELIIRYDLDPSRHPSTAAGNPLFVSGLLAEAARKAGGPVWIVADALDEAEAPAGANPLYLPQVLPEGVYVVVTRRPTGGVFVTVPGTPRSMYRITRNAPEQAEAIEAYLERRLAEDGPIKNVIAQADPPIATAAVVARLKTLSQGNFTYLGYVLADLGARQPGSGPLDLDNLPVGLRAYYDQFWARLRQVRTTQKVAWQELYRPTIERLAVAAESVPADWLGTQLDRDLDEIVDDALHLWERMLGNETVDNVDLWRIFHRSFVDFLGKKVELLTAHWAVADFYIRQPFGDWDEYGVRHAVTHLALAARKGKIANHHTLTELLVALVTDVQFQVKHLELLHDPSAFERLGELALGCVAQDDAATPLFVAQMAMWLVAFRKAQRQAQPIVDLARRGDVEAAEHRLQLFASEMDDDWYQALQLTIAWLAAGANREQARALRDRVPQRVSLTPDQEPLTMLRQRAAVDLDFAPLPSFSLGAPPSLDEARAIVERLSGSTADHSLMSGANVELMAHRTQAAIQMEGYLAGQDGPDLVAFAAAYPDLGEPLLQEYVAIHAGYGYRQYRQNSLLALLQAILRHPSQGWVQAWVAALGVAALAPNRGDFRESLSVAVLAQQARAEVSGAKARLDAQRFEAIQALDSLTPPSRGTNGQGHTKGGDTWGTHRRRLGALAEAYSRLPAGQPTASDLLMEASGLHYGFAGFSAPAYLTLAEAFEVVTSGADLPHHILHAAQASAHNIQDSTFCARTTARVNVMIERWWGTPPTGTFDVVAEAAQFLREPTSPRFTTLHIVGQEYWGRVPVTTVPLAGDLLHAVSLRQLADAYQRPLDEFLRLNREQRWLADTRLPPGTPVNVPDPGFAPLLAARFAARALADQSLSPAQRQATIRSLVPLAARDATMLDLTLARLVLATPSSDADMLAALASVAAASAAEVPPEEELSGRLTSFIP